MAYEHEDASILRMIAQRMLPPEPVPAFVTQPVHNAITFFTDGGAIHPCDITARLAGFAVVQDVATVKIGRAHV